ncbi:hypothetical protein QIG69_28280, partial [Klebsiella pneumoniae]|nr:hypothetical protein [Klebsiella pneumoniae]
TDKNLRNGRRDIIVIIFARYMESESLLFLLFYVIMIIQSKKKVKGRDIMDGIYVLIAGTGDIIFYDSVYDYL